MAAFRRSDKKGQLMGVAALGALACVLQTSTAGTSGGQLAAILPRRAAILVHSASDAQTHEAQTRPSTAASFGLPAAAAAAAVAAAAVFQRSSVSAFSGRGATAKKERKVAVSAYRDGSESRFKDMEALPATATSAAPTTLYDLFNLPENANDAELKRAYYNLQKVCHPDIAGPEGEEMCILLNDAYDILTDPVGRETYNEQIQVADGKKVMEISTDLAPTWDWVPKNNKNAPTWLGRPRSRSLWHKVPEDQRGPKHKAEKFVFVDEWHCIACRNCCDVAPSAFCIDADHGRARVYTQWSLGEEDLEYAVKSCPVDCIYWVSREDLQRLEFVTADKLFQTGELPCSMMIRQGMYKGHDVEDVFSLAEQHAAKAEEKEKKQRERLRGMTVHADRLRVRIAEVFSHLSEGLKKHFAPKPTLWRPATN